MRLGFVGCHFEALPALEALLEARAPLEAVVTLTPERAARRSGAADFSWLCARHGVPLHRVASLNDPDAITLLRDLRLDVVFVLGWSQILSPDALRTARVGMIGAHASLLPRNRGSAPINWALLRGEATAGNTLMWLAEEVDAGPVIDQTEFPITPFDTCATLYARVAESNREMVLRVLPRLLAGERPGRPQPRSDEPLLPRRRPADGAIDWTLPAGRVYDFVRALTRPYPGAFGWLAGRRWMVWQAALLPASNGRPAGADPGTVLGPVLSPVAQACGQAVACGAGAVALLELEADDGRVLRGPALSEQPWAGQRWTGRKDGGPDD